MDMKHYLTQNTANLSDEEKSAIGLSPEIVPAPTDDKIYTEDELYAMVDPATGKHYLIPFLSTADPEYRRQYIDLMRTRLADSDTFARILVGN